MEETSTSSTTMIKLTSSNYVVREKIDSGFISSYLLSILKVLAFFPNKWYQSFSRNIRSKPSLAAVVGCMMPFMLGICFLCPSMDCLWHKYHYCPNCNEKVSEFEKSDPCMVVDPPSWNQPSFAVPA